MMLTRLKEIDHKVIGSKQTLKALKGELVEHLFVATDAEIKVIRPLIELAEKIAVPVTRVKTMIELGQIAGIEIGAAAVAILKIQGD